MDYSVDQLISNYERETCLPARHCLVYAFIPREESLHSEFEREGGTYRAPPCAGCACRRGLERGAPIALMLVEVRPVSPPWRSYRGRVHHIEYEQSARLRINRVSQYGSDLASHSSCLPRDSVARRAKHITYARSKRDCSCALTYMEGTQDAHSIGLFGRCGSSLQLHLLVDAPPLHLHSRTPRRPVRLRRPTTMTHATGGRAPMRAPTMAVRTSATRSRGNRTTRPTTFSKAKAALGPTWDRTLGGQFKMAHTCSPKTAITPRTPRRRRPRIGRGPRGQP